MNAKEIKLLIKENYGRPYYVYGLFYPGGGCFYVGKGSDGRIFRHKYKSHSPEVNVIYKHLGKREPDYEIFNFYLTDRAVSSKGGSSKQGDWNRAY